MSENLTLVLAIIVLAVMAGGLIAAAYSAATPKTERCSC